MLGRLQAKGHKELKERKKIKIIFYVMPSLSFFLEICCWILVRALSWFWGCQIILYLYVFLLHKITKSVIKLSGIFYYCWARSRGPTRPGEHSSWLKWLKFFKRKQTSSKMIPKPIYVNMKKRFINWNSLYVHLTLSLSRQLKINKNFNCMCTSINITQNQYIIFNFNFLSDAFFSPGTNSSRRKYIYLW